MNFSIQSYLKNGGVLLHPTDTVFALSCSIDSEKGYHKIYELKKRGFKKPLGILLSSIEEISNFTTLNQDEIEKMHPFLKEGNTLLLPIHRQLPKHLLAQSEFIGVRVPNHLQTKELIQTVGPLVATSANISGQEPITSTEQAKVLFTDIHILEGQLGSNKPSTILKYTPDGYVLIRS
jgi:L-threonylcarbamoyladenylate synthase